MVVSGQRQEVLARGKCGVDQLQPGLVLRRAGRLPAGRAAGADQGGNRPQARLPLVVGSRHRLIEDEPLALDRMDRRGHLGAVLALAEDGLELAGLGVEDGRDLLVAAHGVVGRVGPAVAASRGERRGRNQARALAVADGAHLGADLVGEAGAVVPDREHRAVRERPGVGAPDLLVADRGDRAILVAEADRGPDRGRAARDGRLHLEALAERMHRGRIGSRDAHAHASACSATAAAAAAEALLQELVPPTAREGYRRILAVDLPVGGEIDRQAGRALVGRALGMRDHGRIDRGHDRLELGQDRRRFGLLREQRGELAEVVGGELPAAVLATVVVGVGTGPGRRGLNGVGRLGEGAGERVDRTHQVRDFGQVGGRARHGRFARFGVGGAPLPDHGLGELARRHPGLAGERVQDPVVRISGARFELLGGDAVRGVGRDGVHHFDLGHQAHVERDQVELGGAGGLERREGVDERGEPHPGLVVGVVVEHPHPGAAVVAEDQGVVLGGEVLQPEGDESDQRLGIGGIHLLEIGEHLGLEPAARVVAGDEQQAAVGPVAVALVVPGGAIEEDEHVDVVGGADRLQLVHIVQHVGLEVAVGVEVVHEGPVALGDGALAARNRLRDRRFGVALGAGRRRPLDQRGGSHRLRGRLGGGSRGAERQGKSGCQADGEDQRNPGRCAVEHDGSSSFVRRSAETVVLQADCQGERRLQPAREVVTTYAAAPRQGTNCAYGGRSSRLV